MTQHLLEIRPVAMAVGGRAEPADDHWTGTAIIRLNQNFPREVVQGLEEFSHLIVVWHFHRAPPAHAPLHARSPRGNPPRPPTRTYAHPTHRRPHHPQTPFPRPSTTPC